MRESGGGRGRYHSSLTSHTPEQNPQAAQFTDLPARIASLFRPHGAHVIGVIVLILLTAGLGVANPVLIRVVFDSALFPPSGSPNLRLLSLLAAVMAGVTVFTGALGILLTYLSSLVGQRVMADLRDRLYGHLQTLSLGFFTGSRTGEIQSRIANDVGGVQNVVTNTLTSVLSNLVTVISTLAAMLVLSWPLTLVAIGILPVFFHISNKVGKRRRALTMESQKAAAEMSVITQETLAVSGMMLSKLFGRQSQEISRFRQANLSYANLIIQRQMAGQSFFALTQIFFSVAPVAVYLLAGYLLAGGQSQGLSPGTIVAFTTLQARLFFPIGSLLQINVELRSSLALFERIFAYLDIKPDIVDAPNAKDLDPSQIKGRITFDSVWLAYDSGGEETAQERIRQWALAGVSFEIEPGQFAALVGPSGAGKTSISYLIPRLYDPTRGVVRIDGYDVRDVSLKSLAAVIGYVSQDTFLFHASIRSNLLYGNPAAPQEQIEAAAKAAHIHDRIMEFPDGYDTLVGERGYRLSGGERQRLSIARVILHDPRVLILDEATSALDTTSERIVQTALAELIQGRTTIAIAHRLSTIMRADVIFVVDHGEIVEQGSHAGLLARGGRYASVYREQFQRGMPENATLD